MKIDLQNLVDKLTSALNFFDFSYFVSGSATFSIVYFTMVKMYGVSLPFKNIWVRIGFAVILIYICGLISFSIGKWIRMFITSIFYRNSCIYKIYRLGKWLKKYRNLTFEEIYDKCSAPYKSEDGLAPSISYVKMWCYLRSSERAKATMDILNKYWVTQAVFEGLVFSCFMGIVCLWVLFSSRALFDVPQAILLSVFIFMAFVGACHEARRNAETQIQEVVGSYYYYVGNTGGIANTTYAL